MKLQIVILTIGLIVSGAAGIAAQQPGAKDLYFGYNPRNQSRRQTTSSNTEQVNRRNTINRTNTGNSRRQTTNTRNNRRTNNSSTNNSSTNAISPAPTGLPGTRITIELSRNGKLSFVSPDYKFRSGDKIRLRLKTNFEGYVGVLNLGTSGKVNVLYPVIDENGNYRDNYVMPTSDYQIPQGDGWIVFDNRKGTETVTVIMSAKPAYRLYSLDGNSAYFKTDKTSKDLFVQTVGADFYAVCPEEILDETVGFTLRLRHS